MPSHCRIVVMGMLVLAVAGCRGALQLEESDHPTVLARQLMEGSSPSSRGEFAVRTLTYGPGDDKNRPEYRDGVAFSTETVDASKLIDLGDQADSRNGYWGFTPEEFPLNGRVWYPDGDGRLRRSQSPGTHTQCRGHLRETRRRTRPRRPDLPPLGARPPTL